MCGCSSRGTEWKREEIGRLFESRRMDVLALCETKMLGRGEVVFGNVSGRKSGLMNVDANASQGVAMIVKEELKEYVRAVLPNRCAAAHWCAANRLLVCRSTLPSLSRRV